MSLGRRRGRPTSCLLKPLDLTGVKAGARLLWPQMQSGVLSADLGQELLRRRAWKRISTEPEPRTGRRRQQRRRPRKNHTRPARFGPGSKRDRCSRQRTYRWREAERGVSAGKAVALTSRVSPGIGSWTALDLDAPGRNDRRRPKKRRGGVQAGSHHAWLTPLRASRPLRAAARKGPVPTVPAWSAKAPRSAPEASSSGKPRPARPRRWSSTAAEEQRAQQQSGHTTGSTASKNRVATYA